MSKAPLKLTHKTLFRELTTVEKRRETDIRQLARNESRTRETRIGDIAHLGYSGKEAEQLLDWASA